MNKLKKTIRKLLYGYKAESETYIEYLRKIGVSVGHGVKIFMPRDTVIDVQNPYMLSIGNHVSMTGPITIMTHDYSWCVFKNIDGRILGNQRPVFIGNNVFIGWGTTILAGSIIEDNVIIGAGSVVTSKCEKNSVYAGNPAKRIMSIEEYRTKRIRKQLEEAKQVARLYYKRYNKIPEMEIFDSYFPIFTSPDNRNYLEKYRKRLELEGNYDISKAFYTDKTRIPICKDFEEFIKECKLGEMDK